MESPLDSSGGAAVLSEENGYSETAVNHSDGDVKQHSIVNGLSNGYDKEKDKERHKDRDKHDKEKYREKDKHRDSDRDKHRTKDGDKEKYRDKDKEKHKEHKERDRDKDKHRDKEREKDKDKERDRNKEKDKERDKDRDKSKHNSSSSSKDKHSSSSSSKDKDRKDRDREKDKERSKHHDDKERKDKDHKSSSSSSKDKEHKSSSSSKHSSSSKPSSESTSKDKEHRDKDKEREKDKERDKNRDKDKERSKDKHSSSSSKDKERHSSDKHKSDREKEKHSSSSSKDKDRHSSDKKDKYKDKERSKDKEKEKAKEKEREKDKSAEDSILDTSHIKSETSPIKEEPESFSFQTSIKEESMDIDDDDGKLMIKEEPTDDESKMESSFDASNVKEEDDDEDDVPMAARMAKMKREMESDDEDDLPLIARKKPKKEGSAKKRKKEESDDEEDFKPAKKKKPIKKETKSTKGKASETSLTESPKKGRKKKEEEEQEVWKWWEEEKKPDGVKWNFLEHKGPVFAPPYEPLPPNVKFYYDGEEMKLSTEAEEIATFYARMLDHDYTTKEAFNKNFMHDWRKKMTREEQETITSLKKCNFKHMHAYFIKLSEERKAMSKEEKKAIKEKNEEMQKEYGFCTIDGHKEKIGNFKIEPPGLFRGRGEHPKMGKLKQRVVAEDIIINCSKDSKVPKPPPGHKWKEVRHDNTVTWLASWTENVQGQVKYIMLNPSSKLKGEKDWQKYETARKLAKSIDKIREDYIADWKSKEMKIRQRAVAMYFIDKLALRAGNEKDEDQADTVGCCSLRVEHIQLMEEKDGKENVVVFDFLGKDSIRYYNEVPVERRVFKNLMLFMENKKPQDDLFDRLNTAVLNKHLSDLMDGLTAKVFRTYNASWTLQAQLKELTDPDTTVAEKLLAYNRANRAVAILCNHQRAVPKTHDKSMANLREKLANKRAAVEEAEKNFKHAKRDAKNGSAKEKIAADKAKKTLERLREQLLKLELQETDKEENKCIALGTSKLNYLDPRISVAWCKKYDIPIEKIYNKTQRDKFRWAIDMATADYVF